MLGSDIVYILIGGWQVSEYVSRALTQRLARKPIPVEAQQTGSGEEVR